MLDPVPIPKVVAIAELERASDPPDPGVVRAALTRPPHLVGCPLVPFLHVLGVMGHCLRGLFLQVGYEGRHFAFDRVRVVEGVSLLDAALAIAEDNTDQVEAWLASGVLASPTDAQARDWSNQGQTFEMVVVKPFVLIHRCDG